MGVTEGDAIAGGGCRLLTAVCGCGSGLNEIEAAWLTSLSDIGDDGDNGDRGEAGVTGLVAPGDGEEGGVVGAGEAGEVSTGRSHWV